MPNVVREDLASSAFGTRYYGRVSKSEGEILIPLSQCAYPRYISFAAIEKIVSSLNNIEKRIKRRWAVPTFNQVSQFTQNCDGYKERWTLR